jgi:hypothetical protein
LEGSADVDEGVTIDGEWAIAGGANDWRGWATKSTSESLDVIY